MGILKRAVIGVVLGGAMVGLLFVLFGSRLGTAGYAIGGVVLFASILGDRIPAANGVLLGVITGGFIGTLWLFEAIRVDDVVLPLLLYMFIPVATYGVAGFVLGRRWDLPTQFVLALLISSSAFLLPFGELGTLALTGYVLLPLLGVSVFVLSSRHKTAGQPS